ncbi:hypothetical protein EGI22_11305 [Lacihabitans sp. LS3-19]|nr:hypothetical protein [Lacihabitans sp. LS3-19]
MKPSLTIKNLIIYFFIHDFCSSFEQTVLHSLFDISVQQEDFAFLLFFLERLIGESAANDESERPTKTVKRAIDFFIFPSI